MPSILSANAGANQPCNQDPGIMEDLALDKLAEHLLHSAVKAGRVIMSHYEGPSEVRTKDDMSPVTQADEDAEAIILADLSRLNPEIPVVAEERAASGEIPEIGEGPFFLVDPLDGTKEFVGRGNAFTVNIALVSEQKPVLGIVYAPAIDRAFWGVVGAGAFSATGLAEIEAAAEPISVRPAGKTIAIVASRSHRTPETDAFIATYDGAEIVSISSSLKFCLIAAGEADLYPRFGPTMEWDTAAGQAVLEAAGGDVVDPDGQPFSYQKPDFRNGNFIARGDRSIPIA
jgi:3'(2'), 5'-bisphosphate nucleotidase